MTSVAVPGLPSGGVRAAHAGRSIVASWAAAAGLHLWAAYAHRNESWLLAAGFVGAAALTVAIEVAALTGVVVLSWRTAGRPPAVNRRAATKLVAWSCLLVLGGGAAIGGGGGHAEVHGHPAGVDVPAAGQPAGALFDFHPEGHEGPCDLFHPCAEGAQP